MTPTATPPPARSKATPSSAGRASPGADPPDDPAHGAPLPTQPSDPPPHHTGNTTPQTADGRAPRLPHERDESSDSQQTRPRTVMRQAAEDLRRGLVDTDKGPVLDVVYENHVRPDDGATRDRDEPRRRT